MFILLIQSSLILFFSYILYAIYNHTCQADDGQTDRQPSPQLHPIMHWYRNATHHAMQRYRQKMQNTPYTLR